jgi:predicted permease
MDTILKEFARAFRSLGKDPGSAAIAVVVLAMGIGLSGFMFSFIHGVYLRGLEIPEADRVFVLTETNVEENQLRRPVPIRTFMDWRERQTMFEGLLSYRSGQTINVAGTESPIRLQGTHVTANAFTLLRVSPLIGRTFAEGDDQPGAPPLLVLGYSAWRDHFGSDPTVIGREVRVHGEPGSIIGVMPEGFLWPNNSDGWIPLRVDPLASERGQVPVSVWGRLRDGATPDLAAMELQGIARQLAEEYPDTNEGIGTALYSPVEISLNDQINSLFATMAAAVVLVLLVACSNVGNLLLARATMRTREGGIRAALGASRWRVTLPFLAEALALSSVGALLGLGLTSFVTSWFDQTTAGNRPWFISFDVAWPTLLFVVGLTLLTALFAAVAPALHLLRTNVSSILKDESRGSSSKRTGRLTRGLVTAEVALSCVLLVGAALMAGSMAKVGTIDFPFERERVLTARIGLNDADYPDIPARRQFWRDFLAELDAEPAIVSASLGHAVQYARGGSGPTRVPVSIDGVDYGDSEERPPINRVAVAPRFFETYRIEITAGRDFRSDDDENSDIVAIVNQPMADRYFRGQNPIGRQFREGVSDSLPLLTVVGVVPDLHVQPPLSANFGEYEPAAYYVPLHQRDYAFVTIVALARGEQASEIAGDIRRAVARVDPSIPIYWVLGQQDLIEQVSTFIRTFGTVFVSFGLAALFMASFGLYGVLAFSVARRTSELGIRMALGADAHRVVRMVLNQGARQIGFGLGLGLLAAFAAAPLLRLLVYEIEPRDPLVFVTVATTIVGVGLLASFMPARRATRVDPIDALRAE